MLQEPVGDQTSAAWAQEAKTVNTMELRYFVAAVIINDLKLSINSQ